MKLEVELTEESMNRLAKKVATRIKKENSDNPTREVIIPSKKDFQYTTREIAAMTKQSEGTFASKDRPSLKGRVESYRRS